MKVVMLAVPDAAAANFLSAMEPIAERAVVNACDAVQAGQAMSPSSQKCYELTVNASAAKSTFTIQPNGAAYIAIFTQLDPTAFEATQHFLQELDGAGVAVIKQLALTQSYEWAGIFDTPDSEYVWTAQKVGLDYVDPGMKMVVLPAATSSLAQLATLVTVAEQAFNHTCDTVMAGQALTPTTYGCYRLALACELHTSSFPIDTTGVSNLAIFAEHFPIEFERDTHYIQDVLGADVEPVAEIPEPAGGKPASGKPWGVAIGSAVLVNLCTLLGVVLLVPGLQSAAVTHSAALYAVGNAFAAGAILACTFFLLLFEATHLIPIMGEAEAVATGKWGAMILAGFLSPMCFDLIVSASLRVCSGRPPSNDGAPTIGIGKDAATLTAVTVSTSADSVPPSPPSSPPPSGSPMPTGQVRILSGVLLGDFMHNFVDGIFIGAAFANCSATKGWVVTAATIYHELAQELADFLILTDPLQGGLKPRTALVLNFLSGISVLLGIIVIFAQDVGNVEQGMLLAYGGGVYIHIGAAECMPQVFELAKSLRLRAASLFAFCIGVIAIGLVLLDHEHCFPDDGTAYAGHNHGRM
uniref:Uncharacterized protein n=1 Tax=Haptolina brevifila TaxID=156173 RepID=A0A7S2JFB7_9EUKA